MKNIVKIIPATPPSIIVKNNGIVRIVGNGEIPHILPDDLKYKVKKQ